MDKGILHQINQYLFNQNGIHWNHQHFIGYTDIHSGIRQPLLEAEYGFGQNLLN